MKKNILLFAVTSVILVSCNSGKQSSQTENSNSAELEMSKEFMAEHNSINAVDWAGVYKGKIPCANCEGIIIEIQLNEDNSYKRILNYLDEDKNKFTDEGAFEWDQTGGKIRFALGEEGASNWYRVGENRLIMLDAEGNKIDNNFPPETYIIEKIDVDYILINKHWKLVKLNGEKISVNAEKGDIEPFIALQREDNKVYGNTGCNNLMGSFKVESNYGEEGEIRFSQIATTRMACRDINYEQDYLKVLENTDNYSIKNDTLSLKTRNKILAKFIGVYMQY